MKYVVQWNRWYAGRHLLAGEVVELPDDDAAALEAATPGVIVPVEDRRALDSAPHDRMQRASNARGGKRRKE